MQWSQPFYEEKRHKIKACLSVITIQKELMYTSRALSTSNKTRSQAITLNFPFCNATHQFLIYI